MKENKWIRLLAYVTGLVNQELLLQNEYLAAENRILRAHLAARLRLSHPERSTVAEIGKRLWRKALAQVASVAKPDTILGRNRPASRPGMDAADGAQRDRRDLGISAAAAIRIARSRHQVLLGVPGRRS